MAERANRKETATSLAEKNHQNQEQSSLKPAGGWRGKFEVSVTCYLYAQPFRVQTFGGDFFLGFFKPF